MRGTGDLGGNWGDWDELVRGWADWDGLGATGERHGEDWDGLGKLQRTGAVMPNRSLLGQGSHRGGGLR